MELSIDTFRGLIHDGTAELGEIVSLRVSQTEEDLVLDTIFVTQTVYTDTYEIPIEGDYIVAKFASAEGFLVDYDFHGTEVMKIFALNKMLINYKEDIEELIEEFLNKNRNDKELKEMAYEFGILTDSLSKLVLYVYSKKAEFHLKNDFIELSETMVYEKEQSVPMESFKESFLLSLFKIQRSANILIGNIK